MSSRVYDSGEHEGRHLLRHETDGRRQASAKRSNRGPLDPGEAAQWGCGAGGPGHRVRPLARHRPPRPQAGQHPADGRRHAQGRRLRPGEALAGRVGADADRLGPGLAQLHGPRAGRGEDVGPAADIYALGGDPVRVLTGRPPFADRAGVRVLWAHLQDDPGDPCAGRSDVPTDVGWAVCCALAKDAAKRPPTATGLARMVQTAADSGSWGGHG